MKKETAKYIMAHLEYNKNQSTLVEFAYTVKEVLEESNYGKCPHVGDTEFVSLVYPEIMDWGEILKDRFTDTTEELSYNSRLFCKEYPIYICRMENIILENLKYIKLDDFIRYFTPFNEENLNKALDSCIREGIDVDVIISSIISRCRMTPESRAKEKNSYVPEILHGKVLDRLIDEIIGRDNKEFMAIYEEWIKISEKKAKVVESKYIREELVTKLLSEMEENKFDGKQLLVIDKISRVKKRYPDQPENKWYEIGMLYIKINPDIYHCDAAELILYEIDNIKDKIRKELYDSNIIINDFKFKF